MQNLEGMGDFVSSAQRDPTIDRKFLAKQTLQTKLAQALKYSLDDYDSFVAFTYKYGEALQHLIEDHEDLTSRILEKVEQNPDADLNPEDVKEIEDLLALPVYSKYLH